MNAASQKRKITQNDLRQMMLEKKRKLTETKRKIDSPLAKYLDDGTLICIICNSAVKSETIWYVHINSKQHRDNITRKKPSREKATPDSTSQSFTVKKDTTPVAVNPPVKLKGILKNKQAVEPVSIPTPSSRSTNNEDSNEMEVDTEVEPTNNTLPEGFFDDPVMDAKARNVDYKDPLDEEMERFQREIQEENVLLEQMLDQDQETAATNKQIEYIDEHIQLWSRMQMLEKKIENTRKLTSERKNVSLSPMQKNEDEDSSYGSEEEFDEYIDWRSKRSFK